MLKDEAGLIDQPKEVAEISLPPIERDGPPATVRRHGTVVLTLKYIWEAWKALGRKIGTFQARVLLTIIYAIIILPFGLAMQLFGDSLRIKKRPASWLDHPQEPMDMQWAKRQ